LAQVSNYCAIGTKFECQTRPNYLTAVVGFFDKGIEYTWRLVKC